ncbi:MAG TPA: sigma factor-like helix-turn-helix DNA-binding protein [Herpetosiphonaceae bacterium]
MKWPRFRSGKSADRPSRLPPPALLDRLYPRVLGFAYQVLGDAELAAQAAETIFVRRDPPQNEVAVWTAAVATMRSYIARGFVVRPLVPQTQSWQTDLLRRLAQLEPMERALLLLRYHEDLELADLAQVLGISEDELRRQVALARGKLLDLANM